jgi:sec-independent protein translocase protein TatC
MTANKKPHDPSNDPHSKSDPPTRPTDPKSNDQFDPDRFRMSFGDHLEELRARLILALLGLFVAALACLLFGQKIQEFLCKPYFAVMKKNGQEPSFISPGPADPFFMYLKVSFISGLIVASPWVIHQIWAFISVGLYPKEQRFAKLFAPVSAGLFIAGAAFLYWIVLPFVLNFFVMFNKSIQVPGLEPPSVVSSEQVNPETNAPLVDRIPILDHNPPAPKPGDIWLNRAQRRIYITDQDQSFSWSVLTDDAQSGILNMFGIREYTTLVLSLMLAFGIAFQLPIAVIFVTTIGLVTIEQLTKVRRYVILGIVVVAAILTPPDVISQIALGIPMYALFELGIVASKFLKGKRQM